MAQVDTSIYRNLQPTVKLQTPFELQGQFQQLQQGQNQNRLAQMQFQKAERDEAQQNALAGAYRDYYAQPTQDPNMLYKTLAGAGQGAAIPGVMETMNKAAKSGVDLNNAKLTGQKMQGEITQAQRERAAAKIGAHLSDPNLTADKILADLQSQVETGELTFEQAQATAQRLPQDPAQLKPFLNQILMSVMKPKELFEANSPKVERADLGGSIALLDQNPNSPTFGKPLAGYGKTPSPEALLTDARGKEANSIKAREVGIIGGKQAFDAEGKMSDDFKAQAKEFVSVRDGYTRLNASLKHATKSAAATLAGATSFMKLLDPGSVVRESELGMALQASGVIDRATNYYNTLKLGKVLTPSQAKDFENIGKQIFEAAQANQKALEAQYAERAGRYGLNPKNIVTDYSIKAPKTVTRTGTVNGKKVVEYSDGSVEYAK